MRQHSTENTPSSFWETIISRADQITRFNPRRHGRRLITHVSSGEGRPLFTGNDNNANTRRLGDEERLLAAHAPKI